MTCSQSRIFKYTASSQSLEQNTSGCEALHLIFHNLFKSVWLKPLAQNCASVFDTQLASEKQALVSAGRSAPEEYFV